MAVIWLGLWWQWPSAPIEFGLHLVLTEGLPIVEQEQILDLLTGKVSSSSRCTLVVVVVLAAVMGLASVATATSSVAPGN